MNSLQCMHEDRVVSAVLSGTWPSEDDALTTHATHCRICSEVVAVAVVLRADHEVARGEAQVPVAGQVWWRSAVRARLESSQAATRPMTWLHGVTAAITIGIMLAVVGFAWPTIVGGAGWLRDVVLPLMATGEISGVVAGVVRHSVFLAAGAAACLVIAPVLLYFVLAND